MKKELGIPLIFVLLLVFPASGAAQEDKFSYLIENGAKMIRENQFDKVLDLIQELPLEKKSDFRIKVVENFAYLKGYVMTKKMEYGEKWKLSYKPLILIRDKSATPILVELLKDENHYVRDYTAAALGYIGDERALEELKKVLDKDEDGKVRRRAMWAYEQIGGKEEGSEERVKISTVIRANEPKYFHKKYCTELKTYANLIGSIMEVSKREALREGYTPCPLCMRGK